MFTAHPQASPEAQRLLELLNMLIGSTFRKILWRNAAGLELTHAQAQVLFFIDQHPGCPMGKVAHTFNVTLPATTQIVDRLVHKQFLIRGTNPTDRRVATLELTETGKALVRELETLQIEGLEPILAHMSTQDRSRLITGLEVFVTAASRLHSGMAG